MNTRELFKEIYILAIRLVGLYMFCQGINSLVTVCMVPNVFLNSLCAAGIYLLAAYLILTTRWHRRAAEGTEAERGRGQVIGNQ